MTYEPRCEVLQSETSTSESTTSIGERNTSSENKGDVTFLVPVVFLVAEILLCQPATARGNWKIGAAAAVTGARIVDRAEPDNMPSLDSADRSCSQTKCHQKRGTAGSLANVQSRSEFAAYSTRMNEFIHGCVEWRTLAHHSSGSPRIHEPRVNDGLSV
jgi:hypothetical protein